MSACCPPGYLVKNQTTAFSAGFRAAGALAFLVAALFPWRALASDSASVDTATGLDSAVGEPVSSATSHPAEGHGGGHSSGPAFPRGTGDYRDPPPGASLGAVLSARAAQEPFNLVATLIFLAAILHTFVTGKFLALAHHFSHRHAERIREGKAPPGSVHVGAGILHFLGEVEVVFGVWAIVLLLAITVTKSWGTAIGYVAGANYTEPMFVVTIMALASTRPIVKLAELMMWRVANLFGGMLVAWWLTILTVGPILGSFVTEPGAMTISALLLAGKLYDLGPSAKFRYATMGLLFVNVSIGGTFTHFAAPPILMVAGPWGWDTAFMLQHFAWKVLIAILVSNTAYYFLFRRELADLQVKYLLIRKKRELQSRYVNRRALESSFGRMVFDLGQRLSFRKEVGEGWRSIASGAKAELAKKLSAEGTEAGLMEEAFEERTGEIEHHELQKALPGLLPEKERPAYRDPDWDKREDFVPGWVMAVHVLFMAWTVLNAHHPALFVGGLLFFLGFAQVTYPYQNRVDLKPPLMVGFFLAGLVIHGGLQGWWLAPVLSRLSEVPLLLGAMALSAFNDNAAVTYLATLVPDFTPELKYAVVAGAVCGGGLTVLANAPNPAGQSILRGYFRPGISPLGLFYAALLPTAAAVLCLLLL